jgi:hypothetical protein
MDSLSDTKKKRILKFLDNLSKDIAGIHDKRIGKDTALRPLVENANITQFYRRFVSPRPFTGKVVDKAKNKFYYETEYFLGEIILRQERFNEETIKYIKRLEGEIKKLKKKK